MVSIKKHKKFYAVLAIFTLAQLVIIGLKWGKPLIWDSTVYIGMGKYLYSLGDLGYWENFRPPLMPLIIGALWKIGVPMTDLPRIIALIFSLTGLTALYRMISDIYGNKIGLYTALMVMMTFTFFWWSPYLLTGISSSFLAFGAIYMIQKQNYFASGILTSLAFLMRFPMGIIAVAIGIYLFVETVERLYTNENKKIAEELNNLSNKGLRYGTGFAILAIPYFLINQYFLGNFLHPIIKGATVPAGNPEEYLYGLYFLINASKHNPFLFLTPFAAFLTFYKSKTKFRLPAIALTLFYGFFTIYPHKEVRFLLAFLPLMALFSAEGIKAIEENIVRKIGFSSLVNVVIIFTIASILISGFHTYNQNNWSNQQRQGYLERSSNMTGTVASNTPNMIPYGDFRFIPIRPETIAEDFREAEENADYYMINSCSWYCTPAINDCKNKIDNFTESVENKYQSIYQKGIKKCTYSIYKVE